MSLNQRYGLWVAGIITAIEAVVVAMWVAEKFM